MDIFEILKQLNNKNISFWDDLSEKEQRGVAPLVLMRWLSGTTDPVQIMLLNEVVNPLIFLLAKHKKLLWCLLTVCTTNPHQRYTWSKIKYAGGNQTNTVTCIKKYLKISSRRAAELVNLVKPSDIILMAEELGYTDQEINKINVELGLSEITTKKPKAKKPKESSELDDNINAFADF